MLLAASKDPDLLLVLRMIDADEDFGKMAFVLQPFVSTLYFNQLKDHIIHSRHNSFVIDEIDQFFQMVSTTEIRMEETTKFTFLNTTGAAQPSAETARLARGHVTKLNFAKRRARLGKAKREEENKRHRKNSKNTLADSSSASSASRGSSIDGPFNLSDNWLSVIDSTSNIWPLFFSDEVNFPDDTQSRSEWMKVVTSEPAFHDASLVAERRLLSSDIWWDERVDPDFHRVINEMVARIQGNQSQTDGILGASLTLAFGERLMQNDMAWLVHLDGVAKIIAERRSRGLQPVPDWASSMFISFVFLFRCPRLYHEKIIDAIGFHGNETLTTVARIVNKIVNMRGSIEAHYKYRFSANYVSENIEKPLQEIRAQVYTLWDHGDADIRATMRAIEALLYLSWPQEDATSLQTLARELKGELCSRAIQPCSFMDLTSGQVLIGAIAAEGDPETRAWYVGLWQRGVSNMQACGWLDPVEIIEQALQRDAGLRWRLHSLLKDIQLSEGGHTLTGATEVSGVSRP
ncbi:hypothetical protein HJFPF1_00287 [Paramyrothecium foliicola]|nr:hypothetical protein HJFPF1_00287 [Paramyrothecium foliicola]